MSHPEDPLSVWLRPVLRRLLDSNGVRQVGLAEEVGISPKHLNQMLQGVIGISPEMAERLLAAFGYQLVIGMTALCEVEEATPGGVQPAGPDQDEGARP